MQFQEKYLQKKENIYFPFAKPEKAFDCVPCRIPWWAMQKLRIDEWIIQVVKSMYNNAHLKIIITSSHSNPINVSVGVHPGSVLSTLLFTVMEALSCEFRTGCLWELLYAHDLVIVGKLRGELKVRLKNWKDELEEKEVKVNVGKTSLVL